MSVSYGQIINFSSISVLLDHVITEITLRDCLREELHRVSLFIVASIAAVFVLSSQYLPPKLDKVCYQIVNDRSRVLSSVMLLLFKIYMFITAPGGTNMALVVW